MLEIENTDMNLWNTIFFRTRIYRIFTDFVLRAKHLRVNPWHQCSIQYQCFLLNTMVLSENQRIEFQIGEKDCHLLSGKEKWNLLWRKNVENLLDFLQQIRQIEMRQQGWLQENDNLFFG